MRVLVTGSSGLVGRPLCEELRAQGDSVDEYDIRPPPGVDVFTPFEPHDIRDLEALRSAVAKVDGVIHLAAVSRCAPAESDPDLARAINVEGTRNVLKAMESDGQSSWFIFASSREVYGEVSSLPVTETFPTRPKAVYGRSKADAEAEIRRFAQEDSRQATILRMTNLYGSPWDYPDRVIPAFVTRARRGQPLEVRGPQHVLDFLHVRDAVRALIRSVALFRSSYSGLELMNIASGEGCTLRSLADQVVALTHSKSLIHEVAPATWTPSKFVADISRARSILGWQPTISLTLGLTDLSAAYDSVQPRA